MFRLDSSVAWRVTADALSHERPCTWDSLVSVAVRCDDRTTSAALKAPTGGGKPVTADTGTPFFVASLTKSVTRALAAVLAASDSLDPSADVRTWIPELAFAGITTDSLLLHASGVRDYLLLLEFARMASPRPVSRARIFELITRQQALNFVPYTRHEYSNSGYHLAAVVMERAAGEAFGTLVERELFGAVDFKHGPSFTTATATAAGPAPVDVHPLGDMGLWMSAPDVTRWFAALTVLEGRLSRWLPSVGVLGTRTIVVGGKPAQAEDGSLWPYQASVVREPTTGITVAALSTSPSVSTRSLAADLAEEAATGIPLPLPRPPALDRAAVGCGPEGTFVSSDGRRMSSVSMRRGRVEIRTQSFEEHFHAAPDAAVVRADATSELHWLSSRYTITDRSTYQGTWHLVGRDRRPIPPTWVGTYGSEELPCEVDIRLRRGEVVVTVAGESEPWWALDDFTLLCNRSRFKAVTADGPRISAFLVDIDTATGVLFKRVT